MRCIIISAGEIKNLEWLKKIINENDIIICADGGAKYLAEINLVPKILIGDFDSISKKEFDFFQDQQTIVKKFSRKKDDTDTALALVEALKYNPDEIIMVGAIGSRFDHSLANVHLLYTASTKNVQAKILTEHNEIGLITPSKPVFITGNKGDTFSLLPLTTKVTGITIKGAEWELTDAIFEIGNPFGISNRLSSSTSKISIKSGLLLVIKVYE